MPFHIRKIDGYNCVSNGKFNNGRFEKGKHIIKVANLVCNIF